MDTNYHNDVSTYYPFSLNYSIFQNIGNMGLQLCLWYGYIDIYSYLYSYIFLGL